MVGMLHPFLRAWVVNFFNWSGNGRRACMVVDLHSAYDTLALCLYDCMAGVWHS